MANLCRISGKHIKSGWTLVLGILGLIGKSMTHESIVKTSFDTVNEILQMHFDLLPEHFEDVLTCLFQYCGNPIESISLKALEKLQWAVNELSNPTSKLVQLFLSSIKVIQDETHTSGYTPLEESNNHIHIKIIRTLDYYP